MTNRTSEQKLKERHAPAPGAVGRTCWICGKPGGVGATDAIAAAGYRIPTTTLSDGTVRRVIAYGHADCIHRARAARGKPPSMPADVRERCLMLRKESKIKGDVSPEDREFLEDCWRKYPEEYSAMSMTVFEETKPFGSR